MCHIIYAVLPSGCDPEPLRRIGKPFGLAFRPINGDLLKVPEGTPYYATARYCDCGTVLGSRLRSSTHGQPDEPTDADLARLRRKGWSGSRISRWTEEKRKAAETRSHRPDSYGETAEQQVQRWLAAIPVLLANGNLPWLGLCYHWHTGAETVVPNRSLTRIVEQLTADRLLTLEEDVLYRFTPSPTLRLCGFA